MPKKDVSNFHDFFSLSRSLSIVVILEMFTYRESLVRAFMVVELLHLLLSKFVRKIHHDSL